MTDARGAQVDPYPLKCLACGHEWIENLLQMVLIDVWVKHIQSLRCPACHVDSHKLAFRWKDAAKL